MYNMKLKLIQPSIYLEKGKLLKFRKTYIPSITMSVLAALTPEETEISYTDEFVDEISLKESSDAVCISLNTFQALRAYDLADSFRKKGIKVILGGIHATICSEEAKEHADSVVIGEAEDVWPEVLNDLKHQMLKPFYKSVCLPELEKTVAPRLEILNLKKYQKMPFSRFPVISLETSRGCPHRCTFCSITQFYGGKQRTKPIENVVKEIKAVEAKYILFSDINITANEQRARELFEALLPLKIRWLGQCNITLADNPELLALAKRSGCYAMYVGIESINQQTLKKLNKSTNKTEKYQKQLKIFGRMGIPVFGSMILGLDSDTEETFKETANFIIKNRIDKISLYPLFPLPGTQVYEELKAENRIIDNQFWLRRDILLFDILYEPKNMSRERLKDLFWQTYEKVYSYRGIVSRLLLPPRPQFLTSLVSNLYYRKMVKQREATFA